jgi:hypothetical protein
MGFLTLLDFRDELDVTFGERNLQDPTYNRWINYGYLDLCTAIDFDILDLEQTFNTAIGVRSYVAPSDPFLLIKHVRDTTCDYSLTWIPKEEFFRLTAADEGTPKRWTLHLNKLWFYPVPDGIYSIIDIYKNTPSLLVEDDDVTVLQAGWDAAVSMLAVHYGYMAMGEEARGIAWYNRAIAYMQSRMTEGGMTRQVPGLLPSFHTGEVNGTINP